MMGSVDRRMLVQRGAYWRMPRHGEPSMTVGLLHGDGGALSRLSITVGLLQSGSAIIRGLVHGGLGLRWALARTVVIVRVSCRVMRCSSPRMSKGLGFGRRPDMSVGEEGPPLQAGAPKPSMTVGLLQGESAEVENR